MTFDEIAAAADFGEATARKAGRDGRWPYVPVIDHGDHTEQIRARAFATRAEAVDDAQRTIDYRREAVARKLADPRHRALREHYGLPSELSDRQ